MGGTDLLNLAIESSIFLRRGRRTKIDGSPLRFAKLCPTTPPFRPSFQTLPFLPFLQMPFIPLHTPLSAEFESLASIVIETWEDSISGTSDLIDVSGDDDDALVIDAEHVKLVLVDDDGEWRCGTQWHCDCANAHKIRPNNVTDEQWNLLTRAITTHFHLKFPQRWRKNNEMDTN